mmetsp:Transcript_8989/g.26716  ORF Transcript_8989/g.26716 Transcript_8989/m.26716 type:complete len:90 (+) Transcript_8989:1046-1315(+)
MPSPVVSKRIQSTAVPPSFWGLPIFLEEEAEEAEEEPPSGTAQTRETPPPEDSSTTDSKKVRSDAPICEEGTMANPPLGSTTSLDRLLW